MPSSNSMSLGSVTVTGAATAIVAANRGRNGVLVWNLSASNVLYLGNAATVTGTTGANNFQVPAGASITLPVSDAIFGIYATGSSAVSYWEV